jgi:hypothetical protein
VNEKKESRAKPEGEKQRNKETTRNQKKKGKKRKEKRATHTRNKKKRKGKKERKKERKIEPHPHAPYWTLPQPASAVQCHWPASRGPGPTETGLRVRGTTSKEQQQTDSKRTNEQTNKQKLLPITATH